jgi:hypothetical protein
LDQYISFLAENSACLHQLDYVMRPQVPFILDEDGNVLVDRLFRLERDMEALNELFQSWGLPRVPHINASRAANIGLDQRQIDRILALYAEDLPMYASLQPSGSPSGSERALRRPAPGFGDCRTNQDGGPGN